MWPFKKKRIIDLTKLRAKTGIVDNTGTATNYKDFSYPQSTPADSSGLGFLGNLASSSSPESSSISQKADLSQQHLKVKIEDVEYKIDNIMRKFSSILDRIDLLEKKMNKFERRGE